MDKLVIVFICCAGLAAWISWLIYNYAIFNKQIVVEAKVDYWKNRVSRVRNCLEDLINAIHKQFPNSTIEYLHNDEIDEIEGEIKY